jgi:TatD DNase family protein
MYCDTHCHLNFDTFKDDWRDAADRAVAAGVEKMIVVGADLDTSYRAVELAQEHPALYAAVGIHPHHARQFPTRLPDGQVSNPPAGRAGFQPACRTGRFSINELMTQLKNLAKQPKIVAIGEVGLDYHVPKHSKYPEDLLPLTEELKTIQRDLFTAQIELSKTLNLPLILHSRECGEEVLEIVNQRSVLRHSSETLGVGAQDSMDSGQSIRGVFHCFAGSKQYLKRIVAGGFYVGFDGDITYEAGKAVVAQTTPLDQLLLETDCPWLTPLPHRGERNEPKHIDLIAQKQADLRGINQTEVAEKTTDNAQRLFKLA